MGRLRRIFDGLELELGPRFLLGRSAGADIRLDDAASSAEHAAVYHDGENWFVKDLSSLNGTQLNESLLQPRTATLLPLNARLRFGGSNEIWEVVDVTAPPETSIAETLLETSLLNEVQLQFEIDSENNNQTPRISISRAGSLTLVPHRAYHSLLLYLAFLRSSHGQGATDGWISSDRFVPNPYVDMETLNVNIFRTRKQFKSIGIKDGQLLIERQSRSRMIRIGTLQYQLSQGAVKFCERSLTEGLW